MQAAGQRSSSKLQRQTATSSSSSSSVKQLQVVAAVAGTEVAELSGALHADIVRNVVSKEINNDL